MASIGPVICVGHDVISAIVRDNVADDGSPIAIPCKRLGLLHPDDSLTVYAPDIGIEQARREAIDCDENQDDPALFTKVISLRVEDIDVLEVPGLKAALKNRAMRQPRRRCADVV